MSLTDQERISVAEWAGVRFVKREDGLPYGRWVASSGLESLPIVRGPTDPNGLPDYDSDPRAYMPLFDQLLRKYEQLACSNTGLVVTLWSQAPANANEIIAHGNSMGEAVCRLVLADIAASPLDKKANS